MYMYTNSVRLVNHRAHRVQKGFRSIDTLTAGMRSRGLSEQ